jgi:glycosyltransferase involved in cell wall biosynthesis
MDTRARSRLADILPSNVAGATPLRPLQICFISETLHAGVGRHIADTVCALADRGHEIHLVYSPIRLEPAFLSAILANPGVKCLAVPMPRAIGAADRAAFRQVRDYVLANGPFDIIHGHSSKGGGYARLLRFFQSAPAVYTPHAFITLSPVTHPVKKLAYGAIEATLGRLTARVICLSTYELQHARQLSIPKRRLAIIGHGIAPIDAPRRDAVRDGLGLKPEQVVVGFVGRMDDQKAPERLVAAARALLPDMPDLTFVMIGDGPKRAPLQAELQSAGLAGRMHWLGAVDARKFMPAMDMIALTSLYEGFAYVLIEALQIGLPIVSTPVGGTEETVETGVNGFIVSHERPKDLVDAIRLLANDPALRATMADASRQRAGRFTVPEMIGAMESLYRSVIRDGA